MRKKKRFLKFKKKWVPKPIYVSERVLCGKIVKTLIEFLAKESPPAGSKVFLDSRCRKAYEVLFPEIDAWFGGIGAKDVDACLKSNLFGLIWGMLLHPNFLPNQSQLKRLEKHEDFFIKISSMEMKEKWRIKHEHKKLLKRCQLKTTDEKLGFQAL